MTRALLGRPPQPRTVSDRLLVSRIVGLCLAAVAMVLIAGDDTGLWLCLPLTLLAAASPPSVRACALATVAAGGAALLTTLASPPASAHAASRPAFALAAAASAAVLIVVRDRLRRECDALRSYALTDPLTKIANRRSLLHRADYEIERHRRSGKSFALVMLDLDGFKGLNDRFGHPAGDDLLRDVAAALQRAMRAQDTVARFGGDEFCVLAPETETDGTARLAGRIVQAVGEVTVGVESVRGSVGVALFPQDGEEPDELLGAADQRLLAAKRRRGGRRREQRAAA